MISGGIFDLGCTDMEEVVLSVLERFLEESSTFFMEIL